MPWAQLFTVPYTTLPLEVAPVGLLAASVIVNSRLCSSAWPAAGPDTRMKVFALMRRPRCDCWFTNHLPCLRRASTIDTPCAACDLRVFAIV